MKIYISRKMLTEEQILVLEEQFPSLAGQAFAEARQKSLNAGLSVLQIENNALWEVFPDGRKIKIKNYE